jgi:hypothetical protein
MRTLYKLMYITYGTNPWIVYGLDVTNTNLSDIGFGFE